jgi:hypothetical protein
MTDYMSHASTVEDNETHNESYRLMRERAHLFMWNLMNMVPADGTALETFAYLKTLVQYNINHVGNSWDDETLSYMCLLGFALKWGSKRVKRKMRKLFVDFTTTFQFSDRVMAKHEDNWPKLNRFKASWSRRFDKKLEKLRSIGE